jgi:hypothetical protein
MKVKIVFVLSSPGAFIFYDEVIRYLASQGHEIDVWHGPINKASLSDRALRAAQSETGTCRTEQLVRSRWSRIAWDLRGLIDCYVYFSPNHLSPWLEKRWENYLSAPLRKMLEVPGFGKWVFSPAVQSLLRAVEKRIPLDTRIVRQVEASRADVFVASPYIYGHSHEVDYARAAHSLGIPTIAVVQSWDNLTTKGTYHHLPDLLCVWNQALLEEAVNIHAIPQQRIAITGAPRFDAWFATSPSTTREQFLGMVGFNRDDIYVTYLCSSNFIAGNETSFVCELADTLAVYPATQHIKLLVRPYPSNAEIWNGISRQNIVVWPPRGDIPDTPDARHHFYDTLYHSIAAFGVNTTAFLEAAIADKPCITAFTEHYQRSQVESAHFQHLMRADFIEIANGLDQAVDHIARTCAGSDPKANSRRRFVHEFIRPHGLSTPASQVMAGVIIALAEKQPVDTFQPSVYEMER